MGTEKVTKVDVLDLYQQGQSTDDVLSTLGQRLNIDTARVLEDTGMSPLRLIQTLTPDRGETPQGEGGPSNLTRMQIDMDALRSRPAGEVAEYMADIMGVDIERLRADTDMSDSDIIVALGDPESVARAGDRGPSFDRFFRGVVRGIPSVIAGAGATVLTAPSGPVSAGVSAIAAGTAAMPLGETLEEFVFGPRVPLPPDEFMRGRFGDVLGTGSMLLLAPYSFTAGMPASRLSFLSSRTGRELTPAESIGVKAVTQPGQSLFSESLALSGGAFGSAAAAQGFPDNDLVQLAAELAGSLAAPAERLTLIVDKGIGPLIRGIDAARTGDMSRLSRRVVLRRPESIDAEGNVTPQEEKLLDLSKGVDRRAAEILRQAGFEQLPATDTGGVSNIMRLRSESALARLVGDIARDFRENPLETANALNAAAGDPQGLRQLAAKYGISPDQIPENLPVVALVDSPTLRAIYTTMQSSPEALGETKTRARRQDLVRGLEGIEQMVRLLQNTGDPEDFAAALALQKEMNESAIDAMLDANLAPVTAAVANLQINDPTTRARAGEEISKAVRESLALARRQETMLYSRVDRSEPLDFSNVQREAQSIMSDLGITTEAGQIDFSRIANPRLRTVLEVIDGITRKSDVVDALDTDNPLAALEAMLAREAQEFAGDGAAEVAIPTIGNALVLKRNLFDRMIASSSSANPDFGTAQYYSRLYGALMDDIGISADAIAQRGGEGLTENQVNLLQANTFSRALNDTFTRAFAGQTLARDARGGNQMIPELLGGKLLSGGDDKVSYMMKDLDDSVTFALNNIDLTPEEAVLAQGRVDTLRSNQETLLRVIASRVTNPATGEINLTALRNLTRPDNPNGIAQALDKFEGLRLDLQNAETAQAALYFAREVASEAAQAQSWLSQKLDGPPGELVEAAIGVPGNSPTDAGARLRGLIRLANQNGGDAAEFARRGLFDTIMDQGVAFSGGAKGEISFDALRDYFFTPLGRRGKEGPTVAAVLREQGFLTDTQLADLNSLLRQGRRIEDALSTSGTDAELREALKEVSPFTIAVVGRFLGAAQGAKLQKALGLSTISIPALTAKIGGQLAERIPTTSLQNTLVKFLDDADFAELILRRSAELERMNPNRAISRAQRMVRDFEAALVRNALIAPIASEVTDLRDRQAFSLLPAPLGMDLQALQESLDPPPESQGRRIMDLQNYLDSVAPPQVAPSAPPPAAPVQAPPPGLPPGQQGAVAQPGASYAALFPNDPIASLMQQREMQQGIGSLAGPR